MSQTAAFDDPTPYLRAFAARGIRATWDWPGMAVLEISPDLTVSTGLHGWHYGSVNRLDDGMWQPAEDVDADLDGVDEDEDDPATIAAAWAAWISGHYGLRYRVVAQTRGLYQIEDTWQRSTGMPVMVWRGSDDPDAAHAKALELNRAHAGYTG